MININRWNLSTNLKSLQRKRRIKLNLHRNLFRPNVHWVCNSMPGRFGSTHRLINAHICLSEALWLMEQMKPISCTPHSDSQYMENVYSTKIHKKRFIQKFRFGWMFYLMTQASRKWNRWVHLFLCGYCTTICLYVCIRWRTSVSRRETVINTTWQIWRIYSYI